VRVEFNERIYRRAAQERLTEANDLHQAGHHVRAFYVSGAAVECILHAYRERNGVENTAGHNLYDLARISGFLGAIPEGLKEEVAEALTDVTTRWSNAHRYRSHDALRAFLVNAGLHRLGRGRTVQGDVVAYNADAIVTGASTIVTVGVRRWNSSSRS
jgi:HEPN domain-containing protein